jgi:hypothetical protein
MAVSVRLIQLQRCAKLAQPSLAGCQDWGWVPCYWQIKDHPNVAHQPYNMNTSHVAHCMNVPQAGGISCSSANTQQSWCNLTTQVTAPTRPACMLSSIQWMYSCFGELQCSLHSQVSSLHDTYKPRSWSLQQLQLTLCTAPPPSTPAQRLPAAEQHSVLPTLSTYILRPCDGTAQVSIESSTSECGTGALQADIAAPQDFDACNCCHCPCWTCIQSQPVLSGFCLPLALLSVVGQYHKKWPLSVHCDCSQAWAKNVMPWAAQNYSSCLSKTPARTRACLTYLLSVSPETGHAVKDCIAAAMSQCAANAVLQASAQLLQRGKPRPPLHDPTPCPNLLHRGQNRGRNRCYLPYICPSLVGSSMPPPVLPARTGPMLHCSHLQCRTRLCSCRGARLHRPTGWTNSEWCCQPYFLKSNPLRALDKVVEGGEIEENSVEGELFDFVHSLQQRT